MKFIVGGVDVNEIDGISRNMINMALPAEGLDGILGLSLSSKVSILNRMFFIIYGYHITCMDFYFANGQLRLQNNFQFVLLQRVHLIRQNLEYTQ